MALAAIAERVETLEFADAVRVKSWGSAQLIPHRRFGPSEDSWYEARQSAPDPCRRGRRPVEYWAGKLLPGKEVDDV